MAITCVTYNVMQGRYEKELLKNILSFIDEYQTDVICLQECALPFRDNLKTYLSKERPSWKTIELALGNKCIAWDSQQLILTKQANITLPALREMTFLEKFLGERFKNRRTALQAYFLYQGKTIRVTSTHLAWEGGYFHRMKQLQTLKTWLEEAPVNHEILCGDFNTLGFPLEKRNLFRKDIEDRLGPSWTNTLPDIEWTCDISCTDYKVRLDIFLRIIRKLGFRCRQLLDYIFVNNIQIQSACMLDTHGADHRPIIATLEI